MKFCLCIIFSIYSFSLIAQITKYSQWTWEKGADSANRLSVYGTRGIAAPNNTPGARAGSAMWKDTVGNIWFFGGVSKGNGDSIYNDLWKYIPSTNQWIWISGDTTANQFGVYGSWRISTPSNKPGARLWAASWVDSLGKFWLYGGRGYYSTAASWSSWTDLNDLWKYDPISNQWTWMQGNNAPPSSTSGWLPWYGTQGQFNSLNNPGSREGSSFWTDKNGNLWLFGGANHDVYNDLWEFDVSINKWTWIKGDDIVNQYGIYGTQGSPAGSNNPGGRAYCSTWIDGSGDFWLFGGLGYDGYSPDYPAALNDLWKYNITSNEWTWINGADVFLQYGNYGTLGVAAPGNMPPSRAAASACTDKDGNFWLFGGIYGTFSPANSQDLWKYDINANNWTWMAGEQGFTNNYGRYGTQGVTTPTNIIGSRYAHQMCSDSSGNLWFFSGVNYNSNSGYLNDIWKLSVTKFIWIGVTSTDWTVGSNWSGGIVPGLNDDAIIPGSTPYNATVPELITVYCRSLTILPYAIVDVAKDAHVIITNN
jgi:hypothetical protein